MANNANEEKSWGGNDLRELKKLVNQIDQDVIDIKAEVQSLKENTSLAALIKTNRRIASAAERIAAALEKQSVNPEMIETVKKIIAEQAAQQATLQKAADSPAKEGNNG